MKLGSLFKRGANLFKIGRAVRSLKNATDEDKRRWAKKYLVEVLGQSRGLPAKVGQFMTFGKEDQELKDALDKAITAMPFDQVVSLLEEKYQAPLDSVFKTLNEDCRSASLGQVHFGKLKDGTEVAVKVQYPEIAQSVEAEMALMGFLPKVGPVAKWGFHMDGYRDAFWNNFKKELDYRQELECQQKYAELAAPLENVIVPKVFPDLSGPTVLVQSLEEGIGLEKAETLAQTSRQAMGRVVVQHYILMLFRHGFVHADPHPGNFAFRQTGREKFSLIVYDYGCILQISDEVRLGLLRIILALQNHEPLDPMACLSMIGFDPEKLQDLRSTLPALLHVLFEPFLIEAPYDIKDWRMSERFDQIVGEMKWWFRSSAPPDLIFLMRTLHGMSTMLERLDAKISWRFILNNLCSDLYSQAQAVSLPEIPCDRENALRLNGIAKYLKVNVVKPNGNKVRLTMPARVADNIKDIIDPPVMESIERQNIDLVAIQKRVHETGFIPQILFDLKDPEREVLVWLE
ncbi:Ubiquinone biosynthesis monooxygenase UbiB [hydrothermal vent metagenome]|uniref:Ubiquinone biosynthesis monooxygenase UbiB n=1 Tax=hydrothermal vent metagenome TaxID=652676 RepID=A0A3B1DRD6_9ZZZZ